MNKVSDRDIESIAGILYDCDILCEDVKELRGYIEHALDNENGSFFISNEALVVFFKNGNCDISNEIVDKFDSARSDGLEKIVCFEIEHNFKNLMTNDDINELRTKVKEETKLYKKNVLYASYTLKNSGNLNNIRIRVDDAFNSIGKKVYEDGKFLYNYNFVANLRDVVNGLYGSLGDSLFDKNVRYEIEGGSGRNVEASIRDTFTKESDLFFFKNNGISLYIKDRNSLHVSLNEIEINKGDTEISVINGAQTITAVSKQIREDLKNFRDESDKEDAFVLLRIYTYDTDKTDDTYNVHKKQDDIDRITVALNQQKPISQEDIAMFSDFVVYINDKYTQEDKYKFKLVKRGDNREAIPMHCYLLKDFAQKAVAVIEKNPGKARTSPKSILKLDDSNNLERNIFKIPETNKEKIFKDYMPINLTFAIWKEISNRNFQKTYLEKNLKSSIKNYKESFIKYGKYFILSIITNSLLGNFSSVEEKNNYERSGYNLKSRKVKDNLYDIIKLIFDYLEEYIKQNEGSGANIDSNYFKSTTKIYDAVITKFSNKQREFMYSIFNEIVETEATLK